uniref:Uncharacterized protein n=1 Tax=Glossina palpalis gambiensis TaxID=67801 RepID=A0A1B0B0Q1_9MUSC
MGNLINSRHLVIRNVVNVNLILTAIIYWSLFLPFLRKYGLRFDDFNPKTFNFQVNKINLNKRHVRINIRMRGDKCTRNLEIFTVNLHSDTDVFKILTSRCKNYLGWYCIMNSNKYTTTFSIKSLKPKYPKISIKSSNLVRQT